MVENIQTSFIPKRAPQEKAPAASPRGIFFIAGIVIFVIALLGAAGAFFYEGYLDGTLVEKRAELEAARAAFEPELIAELIRLDERMEEGELLLRNHQAPSELFELLENETIESVRYTSFSYERNDAGIGVELQGEARSFAALALQSGRFTANPRIVEPVFSEFGVNERGNVTFSFSAKLDPGLVTYTAPLALPPADTETEGDLLPEEALLGDEVFDEQSLDDELSEIEGLLDLEI